MSEWYESLPDELKSAPFFKAGDDGPKELSQVVADLTGAAQHMGNSIRIPGADAGDEAMAEFRQRAASKIPGLMVMPSEDDDEAMMSVFRSMGMPDKPEDYKLPEIEGVDWTATDMGDAKAQAHALGMTQKQFSTMIAKQQEQQTVATERTEHELAEAMTALKGEWGAAYDTRVGMIKDVLAQTDAPEYLTQMLESGKLPPADMRMFHRMADMLGAEGSQVAGQEGSSVTTTPDDALAQLTDIENRADRALFDPMHPDHKRLVKKRVELMMLAYPDSSTGDLRTSWSS